MSLFIKLFSSFWTHKKTLRLRSLIGNDALWVVPRLWSYAAENQPDGDFTEYNDTEIALLLGYSSNAQALLQALHQAGFLVQRKVKDWHEWNEYHHAFSERAKKAARARWAKDSSPTPPTEKIGEDRIGEETSIASSIPQASRNGVIGSRIEASKYNNRKRLNASFEAFWEAYPKGINKGEARLAWMALNPSSELCGNILKAIVSASKSHEWTKENGKYIPKPSNWLKNEGWLNRLEPTKTKSDFSSWKLRPPPQESIA